MVGFQMPLLDKKKLLMIRIVQARGMVTEVDHPSCGPIKLVNTPIKYSEATPGVRSPPPTLGQHTDEILAEILNYGKQDISKLKADGVVA